MGYNNNHAGMHMIWYKRRSNYDDLEYYDRLVEESRRKKELAQKVQMMDKEEKKIENHCMQNNSRKTKQPKKEKVINDKYFRNTTDWYANIFLIAFEKKIDIFEDICECERLCEEDVRMSDEYSDFFSPVTNLDKTIVFLNMLADKMGCDVYEFIFPSADMRRKRVYRALDIIENKYCDSSIEYTFSYGSEGEDDEEEEYVLEQLSMNQYTYLEINTSATENPHCNMEYYFSKISKKDNSEKPIYTFTVMTKHDWLLSGRKRQDFHFMFGGSDIISETEGRLADFFERTKNSYLENGGIKYNYLP